MALKPIKQEVNTYIVLVSSNREGNGTLLQFSCLENPRDRGTFPEIPVSLPFYSIFAPFIKCPWDFV